MLKNYFKMALRNLRKNKIFSFINIFGLSVGLTCFLLIAVFVYNELTYDEYPADAKDIYRVILSVTGNGNVAVYPDVDVEIGPGMKDVFPEVKDFTRIVPSSNYIKYGGKQFEETHIAFADSNFFRTFSIPLKNGNTSNALAQPYCIVISQEFKQKYFGNQDALGKILEIGIDKKPYKVTGIFNKIPDKSHFHFDALLSFSSLKIIHHTWSNLGFYTYLLLNKNADPVKLEAKFPQLVAKYVVPEVQNDMGVSITEAQKAVNTFVFSLQPLTDIHLNSNTQFDLEANGDIKYVYIFSALAIFILLIACINFTNLSTARSAGRAREVGVRKVMGSLKKQLIIQFLTESVLLTFLALICALLLINLLLPFFNQIANKNIAFDFFTKPVPLFGMILLVFIVGIIAGIYPSFFLSSFNTIKVLKGSAIAKGNSGKSLRSGLIIFQFFVSTALIVATIIIYRQFNYMQNKKLGYNKEQVLFLPAASLLGRNQVAFKQKLLQDNRVISASISRSVPAGSIMDGTEIFPINENSNGTQIHSNIYYIDYDYLKTLDIHLVNGRNFSMDFPSDSAGVIINEAAVQKLNWNKTDPIGKYIVRSGQKKYKVIGVVADFNYLSVTQKIAPLMMILGRNYGGLIIKIKTNDVSGFLKDLKKEWNSFNPSGPLKYEFLDNMFASLFVNEKRTQQIFSSFAVIAVIIAGLGLFGLSAFVLEQRTKEIGIRKVLGASLTEIILLLSKEFTKWILIGNIAAWAAAYFLMNEWLINYPYRISIGIGVFILSALITFLVIFITISYHTIKIATMNPVKSLRYE